MVRLGKTHGLLAALGLTLALAACAEPAAYAPREPGGTTGYTDEQLAPNRYRVTFTGNSATTRETVEDDLLRRSAEVTLKAGYRFFEFDTRDTKAHTSYFSTFEGPPWWHGYGWYWHSWAFGPPWGAEDVQPVTRFEAYAEIVMLTPEQAKNDPHAVDAQGVLDHLAAPPPPSPAAK